MFTHKGFVIISQIKPLVHEANIYYKYSLLPPNDSLILGFKLL